MRTGVGLPTTVPGVDGHMLLHWAKEADLGPFSSLGVLDRLLYDSYDPLMSLAAAASSTSRIQLATNILVSPVQNTAWLGKMAASIHGYSNGRLSLGLAVGARPDDYQAAGVDYHSRGRRLALQLATLREQWEDGEINPETRLSRAPELLVGGLSERTFARVARYADGYVHGGGPPRAFSRAAEKVRSAWADAGRPGLPRLWAQGYFALGDETAIERGRAYLAHYYAFTGHFAERIVEGLLTNPQSIAGFMRGYADAGCDELVLFPTVADMQQLDRLAQLVESRGAA